MSWLKVSKDFSYRNTINAKIRYLEELRKTLRYLKDFIFQSGSRAKATNYRIISSSKITSYPSLHEILIEADLCALDSPWKFSKLCEQAIEKTSQLISSLKSERRDLILDKKKGPRKGLVL